MHRVVSLRRRLCDSLCFDVGSKVEAEGVFASTKHHGDTNWDVFCSIVRDLFVI